MSILLVGLSIDYEYEYQVGNLYWYVRCVCCRNRKYQKVPVVPGEPRIINTHIPDSSGIIDGPDSRQLIVGVEVEYQGLAKYTAKYTATLSTTATVLVGVS